jgi:hypothetical protein
VERPAAGAVAAGSDADAFKVVYHAGGGGNRVFCSEYETVANNTCYNHDLDSIGNGGKACIDTNESYGRSLAPVARRDLPAEFRPVRKEGEATPLSPNIPAGRDQQCESWIGPPRWTTTWGRSHAIQTDSVTYRRTPMW